MTALGRKAVPISSSGSLEPAGIRGAAPLLDKGGGRQEKCNSNNLTESSHFSFPALLRHAPGIRHLHQSSSLKYLYSNITFPNVCLNKAFSARPIWLPLSKISCRSTCGGRGYSVNTLPGLQAQGSEFDMKIIMGKAGRGSGHPSSEGADRQILEAP